MVETIHLQLLRATFAAWLNAHAERFVCSIKEKCFSQIVLRVERHLRNAVSGYVEHYHRERNHQGIGNDLIDDEELNDGSGEVRCRERLGGVLEYYIRAAA